MDVNPSSVLRADWQPATEAETAMAAAALDRDQTAYLRALGGTALVLPVTGAAAAGREPANWATSVARGTTYVLAFTSIAALPPGPPMVVRRSPVFDVVRAITELGCGLAVDPGLPIQAFFTPEAVADLREWEPECQPLDAALRAAVAADDRDAYLGALLGARLVLPLPTEADAELEAEPEPESEWTGSAGAGSWTAAGSGPGDQPPADYWTAVRSDRPFVEASAVSRDVTDPEFPWWRTERLDGEPVILAFTSAARMEAELGEREWVEPTFIETVAAWPDWRAGLRLNPGTDAGMELPGDALNRMYDAFVETMRERNPGLRDEDGDRRG
ncbi:SseB family protein [Rugosimonospora africana]|uniref:SseB protein N-terminal domain-containing protein n=1 Tax=Rugosimonospora africana TaxID=556532 RepID=A0A8J3VQ76_9ACTN|nr:SseB family protein [Rugosimonospora africana]GIH14068.1 hypothetical protein Raf01_22400 [Rugosimonospora africana]